MAPVDELRDAQRRARNAMLSWALIAAGGAAAFRLDLAPPREPWRSATGFTFWFAAVCAGYGLWRLCRLWVIRAGLGRSGQQLGLVHIALVRNPVPRMLHELVLVWRDDPWTGGKRTRRPDRVYMADLSEDERVDSFTEPFLRDAWTAVRSDGTPRRGRWFLTDDNLVLTLRRGGPLAWLMCTRGVKRPLDIVPVEQPELSAFAGPLEPVPYRGLLGALLLRAAAMAAFAALLTLEYG